MSKISKNLAIILLALVLVFIDVYCFSFLPIGGVAVLSSFLVVLIFALFLRQDYIILSLSLIIFLSVFSSLESWVSIIFYLVLPSLIIYLRKSFLPEPSVVATAIYFITSLLFFGSFLFLDLADLSSKSFEVILRFILLNTGFGLIFFLFFRKIFQKTSTKIKF